MHVINNLFVRFFSISVTTGLIILLLYLFGNRLNKVYTARWRCRIWLLLAVRLLIPFSPSIPVILIDFSDQVWETSVYEAVDISAAVSEGNVRPENDPAAISRVGSPSQSEVQMDFESDIGILRADFNVKKGVSILSLIWIAGIIVFSGYQIMKYFVYKRSIFRWSRAAKNPVVLKSSAECRKKMGISQEVPVLVSSRAPSPMLLGFTCPSLILPHEDYSEQELYFIFQHELTHYRKKDQWFKLFFLAVNAVHWFNLTVYLMFRAVDLDMECSCDDEVIRGALPAERRAYMETIFNSIEYGLKGNCLSTHINGGARVLKQRFVNILDGSKKRCGVVFAAAVLICCILISGLAAYSPVQETVDDSINGTNGEYGNGGESSSLTEIIPNDKKADTDGKAVFDKNGEYSSRLDLDVRDMEGDEKIKKLETALKKYFTGFYGALLTDSRISFSKEDFASINGYIVAQDVVNKREMYKEHIGSICDLSITEVIVKELDVADDQSLEVKVYVKYSYTYGNTGPENHDSCGNLLEVTIFFDENGYKVWDIDSDSVEVRAVKESLESSRNASVDSSFDSYDAVDDYFREMKENAVGL